LTQELRILLLFNAQLTVPLPQLFPYVFPF